MGIFNILTSPESDERDDALSGTNIAAGRAEFRGSTHSGGDVTVTVEKQYGERQSSAITVEPSVHGTGNQDLTVKELVDLDDVPDEWDLPLDGEGPTDGPISRRIDRHGSVHDYGSLDCHIDRLVIVPPEDPDAYRPTGDDDMLRQFNARGFDAAQELSVNGSVHDRGTLDVTIDHLIVMG